MRKLDRYERQYRRDQLIKAIQWSLGAAILVMLILLVVYASL
jgi:hypothetical protein